MSGSAEETEVRRMRALARRLVEHHFDQGPNRTVYQESGLTNFVFCVYLDEGQFYVRISPEPAKLNAFLKEQWAAAKMRELGVPTPEVLEVGNEVIEHPYMISRAVDGTEATEHPDRLRIVREMGGLAAKINSIETSGFGATFDWSRNHLSRHDTWCEYLEQELGLEDRLATLARQRMLSDERLDAVRSTLEAASDESRQGVLTHGDIRLKNVIVDAGGEIAAIIDWENSTSNLSPEWELSIALHDLTTDEKQAFLAGYEISPDRMIEIAPVVAAINLVNYAPEIQRIADAKDKELLAWYRARLAGAFDLYSL